MQRDFLDLNFSLFDKDLGLRVNLISSDRFQVPNIFEEQKSKKVLTISPVLNSVRS